MKRKVMFVLSLIWAILNGIIAIVNFSSIFLSNSATPDAMSIGLPILFLLLSVSNFVIFLLFAIFLRNSNKD